MHFPLALAFLGLLTSFTNAVPASIVRRNNGGHLTSTGATQTAEATTKTVTANCATATASPLSGTSYVLVVTNGTLSGLIPHESGDDVTTSSTGGSFVVSLLSLEPQAGTNSNNSNLTTSSGFYLIPTFTDAFFVRNEYGTVTVNKVAIVDSESVVPSSTSLAAPTATAGILDDLGNLFDDIVSAAEDLVDTVVETAFLPGFAAIPIIVVELAGDTLEIIGDVVQIVDDVVDIIEEGIDKILDNLPSIPFPIVPVPSGSGFIPPYPPATRSTAGPEPTHTGKPGKGQASGVWSLKPLRGDSSVVVVCGDGKSNGGKEHH
jgi:hypothetical protein